VEEENDEARNLGYKHNGRTTAGVESAIALLDGEREVASGAQNSKDGPARRVR
jgi:hypothetical protein